MLDLIIITGASRGIGANIANHCSSICKTMIVISSSIESIDLPNKECRAIPLKLDLSDFKNAQRKVKECVSEIKDINSIGIVLCASQLGENGGVLDTNLESWAKLYQCNVLGNLAIVKGCADILKAAKSRIVFFAGGGAAFAWPEFSAYSLSKTATVRAAENLSVEMSNKGYDASVIAISPGAVATDMLAKVLESGALVRTKTDISEPINFVVKFLTDQFSSKAMSGKFLHVRDNIGATDFTNNNIFQLRRIQ